MTGQPDPRDAMDRLRAIGVTADVAGTITAGWTGMTVIDTADEPVVVFSCRPGTGADPDSTSLTASVEPVDRPRVLRLALTDEHPTRPRGALGAGLIDLAHPGGRALVALIARAARINVALIEARSGRILCRREAVLDEVAARVLALAAARAGEWHLETTHPPEIDAAEWAAAVRRAPHLLAGAPGVVMVLPDLRDDVLNGDGVLGLRIGPQPGGGTSAVRIVLRRGRAEQAWSLRLAGRAQRALAAGLADQDELTVLSPAPEHTAGVRRLTVRLGANARSALLSAARRAPGPAPGEW